MEEKFLEMLLVKEHLLLVVGIFCVLLLMKFGDDKNPVGRFLFDPKWKWLVGPLNLALSSIGIFLLHLTSFETSNMKILAVLIISAFTTFSYEIVKTPFSNIIGKVMGKKPDEPAPTPPTNPPVNP
jgi:hypothetical protein